MIQKAANLRGALLLGRKPGSARPPRSAALSPAYPCSLLLLQWATRARESSLLVVLL